MSIQIIKQPNEFYAVWSTIVDDFILIDATPEDIIKHIVHECEEKTKKMVNEVIAALSRGEKPYHQFTMTFQEATTQIRQQHGKNAESLKMLAESNCL